MSNFEIFKKEKIKSLIEPFISGMSSHITPIKYEAITPDIFALLFRTTGNDNTEHYFVSLEFDYIESLDAAKQIIEEWHHASLIEFRKPEVGTDGDDFRININDMYQALLAKVERPNGTGYWAANLVVRNLESVDEIVEGLNVKDKDAIRKSLNEIFQKSPSVEISLFIHKDGSADYFYG